MANMSRRERIALLERAEAGGDGLAEDPAARPSRGGSREETRRPSREESGPRKAAARKPSAQREGTPPDDDEEMAGMVSNEDWLEQRRQSRRQRLQQRGGGRARAGEPEPLPTCDEDSGAKGSRAAPEGRRRAARETALGQGDDGGAAPGGLTRPLLEELEDAMRLGSEDPRWPAICSSLGTIAHRLPSGGLARAIKALAFRDPELEGTGLPRDKAALQGAVEALLVCVTPQLGTLEPGLVADTLSVMAAAGVKEQTHLDMLLAQLLVLLRKDRGSFGPFMLSGIAGSLGALHEAGLSAKKAASGASSAANRRCMDALGEQIAKSLEDFGAAEVARLGGTYIVSFLDDVQRRAALRRAAELEVGLALHSCAHLAAMQDTERTVRTASFAFIASLPDLTKDYLMRIKASAKAAGAS